MEITSGESVTIINRTAAEIVLFGDRTVEVKGTKDTPAHTTIEPAFVTYTRKNRASGVVEEQHGRTVSLPGMVRGSFSPNPVVMARKDWARFESQKVVKALIDAAQIEVR